MPAKKGKRAATAEETSEPEIKKIKVKKKVDEKNNESKPDVDKNEQIEEKPKRARAKTKKFKATKLNKEIHEFDDPEKDDAYYYMLSLGDFRPIFLYEFKMNQSAAKTARKINQAFGNDSVNERTVRRWFAKFRSGNFSLEDKLRSGRSRVIQDEDLRILVEADPSQTVRDMAEELGVSSHAVFDGLKRIGKVKNLEKWMPHD